MAKGVHIGLNQLKFMCPVKVIVIVPFHVKAGVYVPRVAQVHSRQLRNMVFSCLRKNTARRVYHLLKIYWLPTTSKYSVYHLLKIYWLPTTSNYSVYHLLKIYWLPTTSN